MKKKLILTFVIALILMLLFSLTCFATEVKPTEDVSLYITEKILPIVVGVLTGVVALVTTLGKIAKSLKGLSDTKDTFEGEAESRRESLENSKKLLEEKVRELKETVNDMPQLKEKVDMLIEECSTIAEILSLGFSASRELVKSGKAHQMAILLENAKCKAQNTKLDETEVVQGEKT